MNALRHILSFLLVGAIAFVSTAAEPPFALTDSGLDTEDARRRFLATHGVNEAIEPKLTQTDRPLYESIAPHLRSDPKQAIQLATAGLTEESNPAFHFLLGNLHYQVEDYANCEKHLRTAIGKFPSFRRAHRTLALSHIQRGQYDKAVAPLLETIKLGGGDDQSYGLLAYSYLSSEKFESALSAYRMARMFKPDSPDFKRGQAHCLLMTGQHKAAIALFDELIAETPSEREYWLLQANAFLGTEQKDKAIANLEILVDSDKADFAALSLLADLHLDQDNHGLALKRYRQAVSDFPPTDPQPTLRPLDYLIQRRLFKDAGDYLRLLREKLGDKIDADSKAARRIAVHEAQIQLEIGDADRGAEMLREALKTDPLNGRNLLLLGEYHLRKADYEQSSIQFERALDDPETKVDARVALGRLAVEQNRLKEALPHLSKAQNLRPNPDVERFLAAIQRALDAQR